MLESISNTFKGVQAVRLATLLKRDHTLAFQNHPFLDAPQKIGS